MWARNMNFRNNIDKVLNILQETKKRYDNRIQIILKAKTQQFLRFKETCSKYY